MLGKGNVYNILTGKPVEKGLSGGISLLGFVAGIFGSFLISILAFPEYGYTGLVLVFTLGFVGTIIDSILGAAIQRKYLSIDGIIQDKPNYSGEKPLKGLRLVSNNIVNYLSLSIVSLLGVFYYLINK